MAIQYTRKIDSITHYPDNVAIFWRVEAADGEKSASAYGEVRIPEKKAKGPDANAAKWVGEAFWAAREAELAERLA